MHLLKRYFEIIMSDIEWKTVTLNEVLDGIKQFLDLD